MAEPMSTLSPEKLNASANIDGAVFNDHHNETVLNDDDDDWHDPPSSPFESHLDFNDQENVAPTPVKHLTGSEEEPQSAFKLSPEKKLRMKERMSPVKMAQALEEEACLRSSTATRTSPKKRASPVKQLAMEEVRSASAMSNESRRSSPSKSPRIADDESTQRVPFLQDSANIIPLSSKRPSSPRNEDALRENEGLTVAMKFMHEARSESEERPTKIHRGSDALATEDTGMDDAEFNPDGPELSSVDMGMDDTCFSNFSEMPGIDMTNFASLRQSPTRNGMLDQSTPRARSQMTPSTVRRAERTPSPTPRRSRKDGDTTNLLLDFTAQFEAFSTSRRSSPSRGPPKSETQPNLLAYINNQRSPVKGGSGYVPATPRNNRPLLNLLDFELPPAPTPRSIPTVTIRELESLKSSFQSQVSSLTASLSGKEAQVESLCKAISDAERRVGEAQETLRDERSAREHAESQMEDWKKKGEEVQKLLQDVQSELASNDSEREQLLARLAEAEKRAEEADQRCSDLETRAIEAESKNVDMTTFINPDEDNAENKKIYSEIECQTAIAEKVNEVARDLHSAYKAKHEKKIKALKESYQRKADERCKELRLQIIRLDRQIDEAEKKHDTFSKVIPDNHLSSSSSSVDPTAEKCEFCNQVPTPSAPTPSLPADLKLIDSLKADLNSLKAKLAGLESELSSLRTSQDALLQDLEAERVEKGELVAAAEQMLAMCGEKMEEMQQEELRKSQAPPAPQQQQQHKRSASTDRPAQSLRSTGFLGGASAPAPVSSRPGSALGGGRPGSALGHERGAHGGSTGTAAAAAGSGVGVGKPSGLRAPGGFGYGGAGASSGLQRSQSGNKSRILSNIERMGGGGGGASGRGVQE